MKTLPLLALLASFTASVCMAQVPAAELAKPPANARHFVIQSTGGKHGDSWSWVTPEGTRMARESMNLRGQIWEMDSSGTAGADGMPVNLTVRGVTPQGDAAESFSIADGKAQWRSPIDSGSSSYSGHAFYSSQGGPIDTSAWLVERLLASPDKTLDLLPGGKARATRLTSLEVNASGGEHQTINLWAISGLSNSPIMVWADRSDGFFALTLGLAWLPEAYAGEQQKMEAAQAAAMAAQTANLAKTLVKAPSGPVAFVNVRMFDAERQRFLEAQTVVVDKGLISAVGPSSRVKAPAGARLIDVRGMTLVPGMWDCHMHVGDDYTGLQELSMGITSVRDPGNNDALTIDRRTRTAAGELLFPHVYPSSLIDGKGPYTAQVANVATSQEEAIALVDKAKANGFTGVKFYGTFNSAWLPATIAEAHKQGLHVHGHIPGASARSKRSTMGTTKSRTSTGSSCRRCPTA